MNNSISTIIDDYLNDLHLPSSPNNLYEPIRYFLKIGGKRIRPKLVLLSNALFSGDVSKGVHTAVAIELFHNFSLIHDDIMDKAPLRRNNSTIHEKWNESIAILSGDRVLIKAYEELCFENSSTLPELLRQFNEMAVLVCEGQQFDMDFELEENISIDSYLNMIYLKTSALIEYALDMGALCGGANFEQRKLLRTFGKNLGMAFQLKDDLLDAYGNSFEVGKQKGGDIISNKKTFLLLKAIEKGNDFDKMNIVNELSNKNVQEKVENMLKIFDKLDVYSETEKIINLYYREAESSLSALEVPFPEYKKEFEKLLFSLKNRTF